MDTSRCIQDVVEVDDYMESSETANAGELDEELKIGMQVKTEEEAYNLYNRYALRKGFSIRKGNRRLINGLIRQREFLCSKQGFREFEDHSNLKKSNNLDTRTGCSAKIRFDVKNDFWNVTYFNDLHNHEFASPAEICNLRSGRKLLTTQGDIISTMVSSSVKPIQSCMYSPKEVVGAHSVGFTKQDYSFLRPVGKETIEARDGQSVFNHFQTRQCEDPMFFYSVQVDQVNRMANFFWRDGKSKLDYEYFGDIVIFDTSYRTNRYNLICAPFVGINHHWKNVLFGCVFLIDETVESYKWVFQTFLTSMGGSQPKSIFTNEDQAIESAIEEIFPNSYHRLCPWNITKSAKQHLGTLYTNPDFYSKFEKCLNGGINEEEFESTWADMIEKYNLHENEWLNRLYKIREKWCPTFGVDIFSVKMKSTLRSESVNNVYNQMTKTSLPLSQIIEFYEEKIAQMRQEELNEDYRCKKGEPTKVASYGGILSHAANVYTIVLFEVFEQEVNSCLGLSFIETSRSDNESVYSLTEVDSERTHTVKFDRSQVTVLCCCKLFETLGLLCCHALRVLIVNNVNSIPEKNIMDRWTKNAKKGVCGITDLCQLNVKASRALRLSELNHLGYKVFDKAYLTNIGTKIVKDKLKEALPLIDKAMENMDLVELIDKVILDPSHVKKRGNPNARTKSQSEKKKEKKLDQQDNDNAKAS